MIKEFAALFTMPVFLLCNKIHTYPRLLPQCLFSKLIEPGQHGYSFSPYRISLRIQLISAFAAQYASVYSPP